MNKNSKFKEENVTNDSAFFDVLTCTGVQVYPLKDTHGKTKAIARVVINEQLMLTGLRIVSGVNGFFVSYPLDPHYKGEDYSSIYYPIKKELKKHIEQCVLEKYHEILSHNYK